MLFFGERHKFQTKSRRTEARRIPTNPQAKTTATSLRLGGVLITHFPYSDDGGHAQPYKSKADTDQPDDYSRNQPLRHHLIIQVFPE